MIPVASTSKLNAGGDGTPAAKRQRRSKVAEACKFCRKSHMSCDAKRPCGRCIKRDIAHLCVDDPLPQSQDSSAAASPAPPPVAAAAPQFAASTGGQASAPPSSTPTFAPTQAASAPAPPQIQQNITAAQPFNLAMLDLAGGNPLLGSDLGFDMRNDHGPSDFQGLGLSEFLRSLDSPFLTEPQQNTLLQPSPVTLDQAAANTTAPAPSFLNDPVIDKNTGEISAPTSPINKTERFLLTAADQKDGSRSDRLSRVIQAKFEAGLLRPYNHVAGYTRLMRWMSDNMSASSRQRTLQTLSEFRPAFRAVASSLTDLDLVFIEEAFERLLLDYDRVFSSMGIPSCLWRRTGEIYKGNKEFADLVGVPIEQLQNGKLAIYELMAEESAVNYWEKYGNIAFDAGQKAVLTSCVLVNQSILNRRRKRAGGERVTHLDDALINCCFSFTIRRDSYAIPSMIVGNFLPISQ